MIELALSINPVVGCWNTDAIEAYKPANAPDAGGALGKIVCDGCVENPAVGYICTARVEMPVTINGTSNPEATAAVVPDLLLVQPAALAA